MQVGLRHLDWRTLEWLAGALRAGGRSRHALCREPVGRTGWRNTRGGPVIPAAAKALPALAERVGEALPPPRAAPDPYAAPAVPAGAVPDTAVALPLGDPGPVRPGPVGGADDRRLWEAMVERHHPRGWARPPGGRTRHWIRSERHGVPGGTGFGSATWRPAARDAWIGWSPEARAAGIARVVRCHRFLLTPGVRVYGLAPEVPPMAAARVADGWEARCSVRPVAACTHVGPETGGHSLHRAGWTCAGHGSGRRPAAGTAPVLALEDGWREAPDRTERRPIGTLAGAYDGGGMDWAERECGRPGHTDGRVRRRIAGMGRAWLDSMGGELPVILPAKAAETAACRLPPDRRVTMETVPQRRHEATADRCRGESLVLAIQDTTTPTCTALEATEGLTRPGGGGKGSTGIPAHAGLAVTAEGRPLGLFTMDADLRDDPEDGSRRWLDGLDRARGLAATCPDTRVVSVRHREGDFRQMPGRAAEHGDAPLVRASRSVRQRVRTEGGEDACLWEHAASLPDPRGGGPDGPGLRRAEGQQGAHRPPGDPRGGGRGPAAEARLRNGAAHDVRSLRHRGRRRRRRGAAALAADGHRTAGGGAAGLHARPHRAGLVPKGMDRRDMVPDAQVRHRRQGQAAGHRRRPAQAPRLRRRHRLPRRRHHHARPRKAGHPRHRGLSGGGHQAPAHPAVRPGPPGDHHDGRRDAAGHQDLHHRPRAPRRGASEEAAAAARGEKGLAGALMRPYRSSALFQNLTSASLPPSGGGFRATGEVQTERRGSMTRSTTRPASYPVRLAGAGPVTIMPDSGGATFRGGRDPSEMNGAASCGEPGPCTVTRPARVPRRPRRAARVFRCSVVPLPSRSQACDRTAPSGTRPVVANLHSATRSLRASATIPRLRERPSRALT